MFPMSDEFAKRLRECFGDDISGGQTKLAKHLGITPLNLLFHIIHLVLLFVFCGDGIILSQITSFT